MKASKIISWFLLVVYIIVLFPLNSIEFLHITSHAYHSLTEKQTEFHIHSHDGDSHHVHSHHHSLLNRLQKVVSESKEDSMSQEQELLKEVRFYIDQVKGETIELFLYGIFINKQVAYKSYILSFFIDILTPPPRMVE